MILNNFYLKLKSYIIFLIIIIPFFLNNINDIKEFLYPYTAYIQMLSVFFIQIWIYNIINLLEILQKEKSGYYIIFSKYYSLLFMLILMIILIIYGPFKYQSDSIIIGLIAFLLGFFWFSSIIFMFIYIAKNLLIIEGRKQPIFNKYFVYLLKLLILPIGIWFIQPIINKLYEENKDKFK
jgi:hypothetical protein